jgi:hypothetical protein
VSRGRRAIELRRGTANSYGRNWLSVAASKRTVVRAMSNRGECSYNDAYVTNT